MSIWLVSVLFKTALEINVAGIRVLTWVMKVIALEEAHKVLDFYPIIREYLHH